MKNDRDSEAIGGSRFRFSANHLYVPKQAEYAEAYRHLEKEAFITESVIRALSLLIAVMSVFQPSLAQSLDKQHGPVVVSTVPTSGDMAVDPAIKEIRVTFSEEMPSDRFLSWDAESDETYPRIAGNPRFLAGKKTCVLPVELEPGKVYAIWINTSKHKGFRNTNNRHAIPYLLKFRTRK